MSNIFCRTYLITYMKNIFEPHEQIEARIARLYPLEPGIGGVEQTQTLIKIKHQTNSKVLWPFGSCR